MEHGSAGQSSIEGATLGEVALLAQYASVIEQAGGYGVMAIDSLSSVFVAEKYHSQSDTRYLTERLGGRKTYTVPGTVKQRIEQLKQAGVPFTSYYVVEMQQAHHFLSFGGRRKTGEYRLMATLQEDPQADRGLVVTLGRWPSTGKRRK